MKNSFKVILSAFAAAGLMIAGTGSFTTPSACAASEPVIMQSSSTRSFDHCTIMLMKAQFDYTGKPVTLGANDLVISDGDYTLKKDVDYRLSYANNTEPGKATVYIKGAGSYTGSTDISFTIMRKPIRMTSLTSGNGGIRVEWEADPTAHAYQIIYSQDKNFDTYHSTTVKNLKRTYVNLINVPKPGETWYVKVRSFVTANGNVAYQRFGTYCKAQSIKTYLGVDKVTIPYISYTYTGSEIKPSVKVKTADGSLVPAGNYTVAYESNVNVGKARIVVKGTGIYGGTFVKEFYIRPKKNEIKTLKSTKKNSFTVTYSKATAGASGYQIIYCKDGKFDSTSKTYHSTTVTNLSTLSKTVTSSANLKSGEKWYVKVRSFVIKNGTTTRYGAYSDVKTVTIK